MHLPLRAIEAGRGCAVNRHALTTLRIRSVHLARADISERGPLADRERLPNTVCEGYAKKSSTVGLAFCFNGLDMPGVATGLLSPVWAMAVRVILIFCNALWGKSALFFNAVMSVGGRQQ